VDNPVSNQLSLDEVKSVAGQRFQSKHYFKFGRRLISVLFIVASLCFLLNIVDGQSGMASRIASIPLFIITGTIGLWLQWKMWKLVSWKRKMFINAYVSRGELVSRDKL
jgi:predicted membrane channel-forming protein YqfA (hemolysin III family)